MDHVAVLNQKVNLVPIPLMTYKLKHLNKLYNEQGANEEMRYNSWGKTTIYDFLNFRSKGFKKHSLSTH